MVDEVVEAHEGVSNYFFDTDAKYDCKNDSNERNDNRELMDDSMHGRSAISNALAISSFNKNNKNSIFTCIIYHWSVDISSQVTNTHMDGRRPVASESETVVLMCGRWTDRLTQDRSFFFLFISFAVGTIYALRLSYEHRFKFILMWM